MDELDATKQALTAKEAFLKETTHKYGRSELALPIARTAIGRKEEVMRDYDEQVCTVYSRYCVQRRLAIAINYTPCLVTRNRAACA